MVGGVSLRGGKAPGQRSDEDRWRRESLRRLDQPSQRGSKNGVPHSLRGLQRVRVLALLGFRLCLRTAFRFRHVNPAHNRVTIDENAAEENGIRRRQRPLLHQRFQALD
jgi:hypothetical protein